MDEQLLSEAITKQMDALEGYVNAVVLLAVAAAWGGLRRAQELEAFGLKFNRRHAFWILGVTYLIANVAALVLFLRIRDLLGLVQNGTFVRAFTGLALHPWVLNPFSFFGGQTLSAKLHSSGGWGLLILTWWVCNTSLATLMDDKRNSLALALMAAFVIIGLGATVAIYEAQQTVFRRLAEVAPELLRQVEGARPLRMAGTLFGIATGLSIFLGANRLQERILGPTAG